MQPRGQKVKKEWVARMVGLYREEQLGKGQPSPWAGEFGVEGRICQPHPVTDRD